MACGEEEMFLVVLHHWGLIFLDSFGLCCIGSSTNGFGGSTGGLNKWSYHLAPFAVRTQAKDEQGFK